MRCHSRFREYLRGLLDQRGNAAVCELRAAYGRLLARRGFPRGGGQGTTGGRCADRRVHVGQACDSRSHCASGLRRCRSLDRGAIARLCRSATSVRRRPADAGDARDDQRHGARIADELAAARTTRAARGNLGTRRRADGMVLPAGTGASMRCTPCSTRRPPVRASTSCVTPSPWCEPGAVLPDLSPPAACWTACCTGLIIFVGRLRELTGDPPSPWTRVAMGHGPDWCAARYRTYRRGAAAVRGGTACGLFRRRGGRRHRTGCATRRRTGR